jgi:hypothetical protein
MSEVLARIRVRETAGIRRFLYPKVVTLQLPVDSDTTQFKFILPDGQPIPTEFQAAEPDYLEKEGRKRFSIRFALSLAPYEEVELALQYGGFDGSLVDDPLSIERTENGGLTNSQKRFSISLAKSAAISQVIYDGITHLRSPDKIELNGFVVPDGFPNATTGSHLALQYSAAGGYSRETPGERNIEDFLSVTSLTACKSWAERYHWVHEPIAHDEIVFTLPLAITSKTLTCDFGVGGYVFGKLDSKATEIVWHTKFGDTPYAKWTVATAGRVDYVGEVDSAEAFLPQRWFHLIDSDKALAVAITKMPNACQSLTVRLTIEGDVSIAFTLGDTVTGHADFGVCYHFLNDVPAIAAATNPQSILLPPLVEVLTA